jgi:hypothetical protein
MGQRSDGIDVAALSGHLGDGRQRSVQRAAWTGNELDDQALAAAAALTAAHEARVLFRAVLAFAGLG